VHTSYIIETATTRRGGSANLTTETRKINDDRPGEEVPKLVFADPIGFTICQRHVHAHLFGSRLGAARSGLPYCSRPMIDDRETTTQQYGPRRKGTGDDDRRGRM